MKYSLLERLAEKVSILEQKMAENSNFYNSGEFEDLYQEVMELFNAVQDFEIDAFPYETATEKMLNVHHLKSNKLKNLSKRIKRIEDDAEMEDDDEIDNSDDD